MLLSVAQWPSWNVMCGDVWHNGILIWKGSHKRIDFETTCCSPVLGAGPGPCYMQVRKSAYELADAPLRWSGGRSQIEVRRMGEAPNRPMLLPAFRG